MVMITYKLPDILITITDTCRHPLEASQAWIQLLIKFHWLFPSPEAP